MKKELAVFWTRLFKPYLVLPFQVYILFLARIINRMGDFVIFFLTLYLTTFLNFSEDQAGIVVSFVGICSLCGSLLGGMLTDRSGRKKLILLFYSLSAFSVISCGFFPDSTVIVPALLLFILFNGAARPISTALLTDITTKEERPAAFSLLYLGINIGVSVGPLIAGFLFNAHRRWLFWGDGLTTLLSLILIDFFVKEPARCKAADTKNSSYKEGSSLKALKEIPVLFWFFILSVFAAFVYSQHSFTIPLQLQTLFGDRSAVIFGKIMSVNAVTVLVLTPLLNNLFHNRPPIRQIALSQLCYGLGFALLIIPVARPVFFYLVTIIWTTGEILSSINSGVFIANNSPVNHRGRFSSFYLITKGIGSTLAPLVSGLVIGSRGIAFMWVIVVTIAVLLYGLMMGLDKRFGRSQIAR
ncbi:MAG: MFS transporter [Treponema sp.]|jgi:MFS family permease|nr:MFS transporter [Treponema sp.]